MTALCRSQRGAIMIAGVFMAIFATGCLYYVVALGDAITQRERMQDAADAAAFSAAALSARGMNVIALVNMTMAALLAVLITLKLVELLAYVGVAMAVGLAFVTQGFTLGAVAPLTQLAVNVHIAHDEALPVVQGSLRTLHVAARGVRVVMPWVAQGRTIETVIDHYDPPASFGFEVPGSLTLPTRDGTYDDLCRKSGEYVGDLVAHLFTPVQRFGLPIGAATARVVDTGSTWFCQTDGARRPGTNVRREVAQPILPKARQCESYASSEDPDPQEHVRICTEATAEIEAADAAIDPTTGECLSDCDGDGLYEQRAELALAACAPRVVGDSALYDFKWRAHVFKRAYRFVNLRWVVETEIVPGSERYELRSDTPRPCGTAYAMSPEWNTERLRDGEPVSVCDNIAPPTSTQAVIDGYAELEHIEVMRIFGCTEKITERREISDGEGELSAGGDGADMAPQLIAQGAALGGEPFQIRAVVVGQPSRSSPDPLLALVQDTTDAATEAESRAWSLASQLGRISVAQAEFYFDAASPEPTDLLWSMGWTARLRRFRLAGSEPDEQPADDAADVAQHGAGKVLGSLDACSLASGGDPICRQLDLSAISDLIAH